MKKYISLFLVILLGFTMTACGNAENASDSYMDRISKLDEEKSLILNVQSIDEVFRLHNIRFYQ